MTARASTPGGRCIADLRSPMAGRLGVEPFPFDALAVGDWFTVRVALRFGYARSQAHEHGQRLGRSFSCRIDDDGALRVIRVL